MRNQWLRRRTRTHERVTTTHILHKTDEGRRAGEAEDDE